MNRTLKRPMFRMGGAADGITSGLDKPRQQYNQAGMVKNQFEADRLAQNAAKMKDAAMSVFLKGAEARGQFDQEPASSIQLSGDTATSGLTRDEIIAQAMADAKQFSGSQEPMSGREMAARFLIPFGLNFATATPSGGLLSTAAAAAKNPVDMLIKGIDQRRDAKNEREADLFSALLSSGLQERREGKKIAAQELKDSKELLTLYDRTLEKNVIVQAGDVYKNLANYGPAQADKEGRTFEKLEVANLIEQKMAEIFELEAKEDKSEEDLQEIEKAKGVLEYLQGNKNTSAF